MEVHARFAFLAERLAALAALALLLAAPGRAAELVPLPQEPPGVPWPTLAWPLHPPGPDVDLARLAAGMDGVFAPVGRGGLPDTRALLVVHRGAIVAERYAPGFGPDTRLHSWSMAKSVTQALVGILVRKGKLDLAATADVPAWRAPDDPRRALTLGHLLRMNSGLDADDDLEGVSSTADLLFGRPALDMEGRAVSFPLAHPPGIRWAYSTATTMVVAGIVGRAVGGGKAGVLAFMRRELFDPLGMRSAVPEFDAAGTFMGGGFVYATARDWARFGLLYLRGGVWDGERILPEGWVDYSRTPAPAENNRVFGAHLWLNAEPGSGKYQFPILPGGPPSAFGAAGARGQYVVLLPTHDLILVRLGEMEAVTEEELAGRLAQIAAAFPALEAQRLDAAVGVGGGGP